MIDDTAVRLCQLRDELLKTSIGREFLADICEQLKAVSKLSHSGLFLAQQQAFKRVMAERDAAVSDLKRAAQMFGFCDFCDNVREIKDVDMEHRCQTCLRHGNYAWKVHT